jgi:hypothetical protein
LTALHMMCRSIRETRRHRETRRYREMRRYRETPPLGSVDRRSPCGLMLVCQEG